MYFQESHLKPCLSLDRSSLYPRPLPRCCFGEFAPPVPSTHFLTYHSASVSITGRKPWQGRPLSSAWRRGKHGLMRNVREQPCSFVRSPASLPAFQSTAQTSECLDKGRLCPSSAGYTLPRSCPPSYPSLHPAAPPLPPSFHSPGLRPRIVQQVPSENRAGGFGRVRLPFQFVSYIVLSFSQQKSKFWVLFLEINWAVNVFGGCNKKS